MNIPGVNNAANPAGNTTPLQQAEQPNRDERNQPQQAGTAEPNTDNYTPTQEGDRLRQLTDRRQAIRNELDTIRQNQQNQQQGGENRNTIQEQTAQTRGGDLERELNQIEQEIRNIARPENTNPTASRRAREAIAQYTEQNQATIRNQQQGPQQEILNLFGRG